MDSIILIAYIDLSQDFPIVVCEMTLLSILYQRSISINSIDLLTAGILFYRYSINDYLRIAYKFL